MRRLCLQLLGLVLLIVVATPTWSRQNASVSFAQSDVTVDAAMDWPGWCSKGYVPFRITIDNGSSSSEVLEVSLVSRNAGTSTRTVEAPAGITEFAMLFPAFNRDDSLRGSFIGWLNDYSVRLRVTQGLREESDYGAGSVQGHSSERIQTFILLTAAPEEHADPDDWILEIARDLESVSRRSTPRVIPDIQGTVVPFDRAPERFEAYTSLDCVVVDLSLGFPEREPLEAVLRWVRLGGTLLLVAPNAIDVASAQAELRGWFEDRFTRPVASFERAHVTQVGLGRVMTLDSTELALSEATSRRALQWAVKSSRNPSPERGGGAAFELKQTGSGVSVKQRKGAKPLPPPDDVGDGPLISGLKRVPYRTLAIGLSLFTLLLGPVNFWIVRRLRRPMLLVATIPATSLVAGLVIIGFGLLSGGVSDRTAEFSYTVLDQRTHRASGVNLRSLWCAFSPSALRPEAGSVVLPGQRKAIEYETVGFLVDESNGLALSGDFLPVRRSDRQVLLSEQTFRGRVEFTREGASWQVTNGLGFDLDVFVYCDPEGEIFVLEGGLTEGARDALVAAPARARRTSKDTLAGLMRWVGYADPESVVRGRELSAEHRALYLDKIQDTELVPGSYLAVSQGASTCLPDLGLDPKKTFARHVLMGLIDGEAGL